MIEKCRSVLGLALALGAMPLLGGCKAVLLDPKGWVGASEKELILIATGLMLLVVIPVCIMTVAFAWRYRASNTNATYKPDWSHSNTIEFFMWSIPVAIIAILAVLTWRSSHALDPYKPLDNVPGKPLVIEAVALNWKWLFIYPEQHIATVNYVEFPAHRPIHFKLATDAPMNSFMIPQLGGQIYAMPGMQSQLHLVADEEGVFDGRAFSYSGGGFSNMLFKAGATSEQHFNEWVYSVQLSDNPLTITEYNRINKPSENHPVTLYSSVKDHLFQDIIMQYMMPGMRDDKGNLITMNHHENASMIKASSTAGAGQEDTVNSLAERHHQHDSVNSPTVTMAAAAPSNPH